MNYVYTFFDLVEKRGDRIGHGLNGIRNTKPNNKIRINQKNEKEPKITQKQNKTRKGPNKTQPGFSVFF